MPHVITFKTNRFDVTKEQPNEANAIAGQGVLGWLREELDKHHYQSSVPDMEDWGWYMDVKGSGGSYMVGPRAEVEYKNAESDALAYAATGNEVLDWTLQIHKQRTSVEKLLGKNKLAADDQLCAQVEAILKRDGSIKEVSVMPSNTSLERTREG